MTARKLAISLPEELFQRLEHDRLERNMNRSEYVANAVADHLHRMRTALVQSTNLGPSAVMITLPG